MTIPVEEARLWRVQALGGLELLRATFVQFTFPKHTHEEFMIALTEAGPARPWYRGGDHLLGPDDLLVLNPGEVHAGGPVPGIVWRYRALYPSPDLMRRAVRELAGTDRPFPQFDETVVRDRVVATAIRRAHRACEDSASTLERETRLLDALAGLISRHAVTRVAVQPLRTEHRAVHRAREYLDAHATENVSLERLAGEAGVSSFHLCRLFRRETGLSPHAYQTLVRVRYAKGLLSEGVPIPQSAVDAGFCDQAHLTRHFKRVYGVTPGRYVGGIRRN